MTQDGLGDALDVVGRDVGGAGEQRRGLGGEDEVLAGAGARAPLEVVVDELGALEAEVHRLLDAGGADEAEGVGDDVVGDRHGADGVLDAADAGLVEGLDDGLAALGGAAADDLHLFAGGGVLDLDLEHEAVELGLGEGVGAFLLDGVLGGEDEEGLGQVVAAAATVTWRSCMASRSAAWVLGGVRLISSARMTLAKTGPRTNLSSRWPVVLSSWMTSVPVMSAGMRSGVNWMRLKCRLRVRAIVEMSSVLARPGTPTTTAWPRQKMAMSI